MREILFRGKRLDNGEWIEGCLFKLTINGEWIEGCLFKLTLNGEVVNLIFEDSFSFVGNNVKALSHAPVDPNTVGQYTGLTDKNGKKIFEGDILKTAIGVGYVVYGTACFSMQDIHSQNRPALDIVEDVSGLEIEVIGNIHDNPELLK